MRRCVSVEVCALFAVACLVGEKAAAATIYVGASDGHRTTQAYGSIQSGIDAAYDHELIIVRDGTYAGDIDLKGKAVHVKSENGPGACIISATEISAFSFSSGEGRDTVVEGFTIQGRRRSSGMYCTNSSPTILNNRLIDNSTSFADGGGIYCYMSSPLIVGNIIAQNWASSGVGGGICIHGGSPDLVNNTIVSNRSAGYNYTGYGGGVYCGYGAVVSMKGCIVWGSSATCGPQIAVMGLARLSIDYSDIQGGKEGVYVPLGGMLTWGRGNLNSDPLLHADWHLLSRYGRRASPDTWVLDGSTSPCINAGDPASDFSKQPQPSRRIEIGAYGNTAEASKGKWILPGDTNGDSTVNILDLIIVRNLLSNDPLIGDNWQADVNEDGKINILDLLLVRNRLGTKRE